MNITALQRWHRLSRERRQAYLQAHPRSRYHRPPYSIGSHHVAKLIQDTHRQHGSPRAYALKDEGPVSGYDRHRHLSRMHVDQLIPAIQRMNRDLKALGFRKSRKARRSNHWIHPASRHVVNVSVKPSRKKGQAILQTLHIHPQAPDLSKRRPVAKQVLKVKAQDEKLFRIHTKHDGARYLHQLLSPDGLEIMLRGTTTAKPPQYMLDKRKLLNEQLNRRPMKVVAPSYNTHRQHQIHSFLQVLAAKGLSLPQLRKLLQGVVAKNESTIKSLHGATNPQSMEVAVKARARYDLAKAILAALSGDTIDLKMEAQAAQAAFDVSGPQIYVDLDGVLADFVAGCVQAFGKTPEELGEDLWPFIVNYPSFFAKLPKTKGCDRLWTALRPYQPKVLSTCEQVERLIKDKKLWCSQNLTGASGSNVIISPPDRKPSFMCRAGDILIDDRPKEIAAWQAAGGIGILHTGDFDKTLAQLLLHLSAPSVEVKQCA